MHAGHEGPELIVSLVCINDPGLKLCHQHLLHKGIIKAQKQSEIDPLRVRFKPIDSTEVQLSQNTLQICCWHSLFPDDKKAIRELPGRKALRIGREHTGTRRILS